MLEFGASFRKARESKDVSLDKIAVETRISTRFLTAIENEQFELLPGGIFNRGFIRTYAEHLGLAPEEAIAAYEKLIKPVEPEPELQAAPVRGKTTKIPVYGVAIAGLILMVAVYYVTTRPSERNNTAPPAAEAATPKPETAGPTIVADGTEPAAAAATDAVAITFTATPAASNIAGTASAANTANAPNAPATPPAPATTAATTPATKAQAAQVAAPVAAAANAAVVLEIEAREDSWFKLSADGATVVASEILPAGTVRRYTAGTSMNVSIGNAGGVSLRVNGQSVSSLGKTGQVREITITPKTSAASLASAPH